MAIRKRLFGPTQLGTTAVTVYTVPTNVRTTLQHIHAINQTGAQRTITISIGTDGAGTRIYDAWPIAVGDELDRWCKYVLEDGEIIQAYASDASAINLTLDGEEDLAV